MCGIAGWIECSPNSQYDKNTVAHRMNRILAHRGPDDSGVVVFDDAALSMSRLSIIDLKTGHQPISNERKDCWIICNGEIYNFMELRTELEQKGHRFTTRSDTEVILHAYEEWGEDCVKRLRGMFAFAIYDHRPRHRSRSILFIARDRVGKKPLYYFNDSRGLVFASEIKALFPHPYVPRELNHSAIPSYLSFGYVPAPDTMFKNIHELPPGHTLKVEGDQINIKPYWEFPFGDSSYNGQNENDIIYLLKEKLEEAVRVRLISDVPLGAFLSGGLDSTAIVAYMARNSDKPVKTFAIGFRGEPSFNELQFAAQASKAFKTEHHEYVVSPEVIDLLPKLVWHHDQPFSDSSAIPTYLMSKLTRNHVTVALSGDGGDELFAGYERFAAARLADKYNRIPVSVQNLIRKTARCLPESTAYYGFNKRLRRFLDYASLPLPQQYLGWVGIFDAALARELLIGGYEFTSEGDFSRYFEPVKDQDLLSQLLYVNGKTYLPGDLLTKTDRMSMACSLEVRSPFLDQELIEFASHIPPHLKLKGLTTKYILKKALKDIVPESILKRKKHGFGVPIGKWFRKDLQGYLRETLLATKSLRRGYFNETCVRRLVEEHVLGKRDHGHRLWALITFEIWHQTFIDRAPDFG